MNLSPSKFWLRSAFLGLVLLGAGTVVAQGGPPPPPPPPQLPPVPVPPQNPITDAKRVLGKILFWEEQLSSDNTVSCGTCHRPTSGGTDPRLAVHPGLDGQFNTPDDINGSRGVVHSNAAGLYEPVTPFGLQLQVTSRRAPDFTGSAYSPLSFWDGRASGTFVNPDTGLVSIPVGGALESQSIQPMLSDVEMAHTGRIFADATTKLQTAKPMALATNVPVDMANAITANPTYAALFQAAFGSPAITIERVAFALATYERTLVPNQTRFDQFAAGNPGALTMQEMQGFMAFNGPGRCNVCHTGPTFSDNTFRNLGLRPIAEDRGRQNVTNNPADRGRFKVPSLRNAALRPRFMHNGNIPTLNNVLGFYSGGGGPFPDNKDPVLGTIALSQLQRDAIVAFLNTLTDSRAQNGQFPFDRPPLFIERVPIGSNRFGLGTAGSGGTIPNMLSFEPPHLGSLDFRIGLAQARPGSGAFLGLSLGPNTPGQSISGVPFHLDLASAMFLPAVTQGAGPAGGFATLPIDVPADPLLAGLEVLAQWFIADPNGTSGVSATQGARFNLF